MKKKIFRSSLEANSVQAAPAVCTEDFFDKNYKEQEISAISEFMARLLTINRLIPAPEEFCELHGQSALLATVAAVESYLRTIIRRIIVADEIAKSSAVQHSVSFGAALHLSKDMLPEAILESYSFTSKTNVHEALKKLLAVKGELPSNVVESVFEYERVCQLRHCAVHRFGKLGARSAIALGLSDHCELLEKPLSLQYADTQKIVAICSSFVKTINNFLLNELLSRIDISSWSGTYQDDKAQFGKYYNLFRDTVSYQKSRIPSSAYRLFRKQIRDYQRSSHSTT